MIVVEVKNLSKKFDREVLFCINLNLYENRTLGLVGRNGAGKTTLIKIIMGFLQPTKGEVKVFGAVPGRSAGAIGYLPEKTDYHLLFSGREYLTHLARISGIKRADERVTEVLSVVGMDGYGSLRMSRYSKGMLQRIGVAQVLLHDPKFLILDEPLSGLDPAGRKELRDLIIQLGTMNKTILMCSHILSEVENVCSDIAIIHKGEIVQQGSLKELLEHKNKYKLQLTGLSRELLNKISELHLFQLVSAGFFVLSERRVGEKEECIKTLIDNGIRIDELVPLKRTLEEQFLIFTGGGNE